MHRLLQYNSFAIGNSWIKPYLLAANRRCKLIDKEIISIGRYVWLCEIESLFGFQLEISIVLMNYINTASDFMLCWK